MNLLPGLLAKLPPTYRKIVYLAALILGLLVLVGYVVAAIAQRDTTPTVSIFGAGLTLDPATGLVALALSAIGALAHVHLDAATLVKVLTAVQDAIEAVPEVTAEKTAAKVTKKTAKKKASST